MVDIELMDELLITYENSLLKPLIIILGDDNQLPSVGPGAILKDIIESDLFDVSELKQTVRQGKDSNIIVNANNVIKVRDLKR